MVLSGVIKSEENTSGVVWCAEGGGECGMYIEFESNKICMGYRVSRVQQLV